jgi:hypothetical protein
MAPHRSRHEDHAGTKSELTARTLKLNIAFFDRSGFLRAAVVRLCPGEHNETVFLPIVAERLQESVRIDYTLRWGWEAKGGVNEARFL